MITERRIAYVFIRIEDVFGLLMPGAPDYIERLRVPGLPADIKALHVAVEHETNCLCVLVYHPSFAEIPYGERIPAMPGGMAERYVLARVEGDADPPVYREVK